MTLKVWILFFVPELGAVNKMHAITSNCFLESERIWGSLLFFCRLPPWLLLFKTKICRTGDPAGGATSFGAAAGPQDHHFSWWGGRSRRGLCAPPRAFEGWRGRREAYPDLWVCASREGRAGRGGGGRGRLPAAAAAAAGAGAVGEAAEL